MKYATILLCALFACSAPPAETPAEAPPPSELTRENFLEPGHIREALQGMDRIFATRVVPRSGEVYELSSPTESDSPCATASSNSTLRVRLVRRI